MLENHFSISLYASKMKNIIKILKKNKIDFNGMFINCLFSIFEKKKMVQM